MVRVLINYETNFIVPLDEADTSLPDPDKARADARDYESKMKLNFGLYLSAKREDRLSEAKVFLIKSAVYSRLMDKSNDRAVQAIISSQDLLKGDRIDLHGLNAHEAVAETDKFVRSCIGKSLSAQVQVITGRGNHSENGAVLKPAIIAFCKWRRWAFETPELNTGVVIVSIPTSSTEDSDPNQSGININPHTDLFILRLRASIGHCYKIPEQTRFNDDILMDSQRRSDAESIDLRGLLNGTTAAEITKEFVGSKICTTLRTTTILTKYKTSIRRAIIKLIKLEKWESFEFPRGSFVVFIPF
jgi:DNA-nicking Smr family endonuclease